MFAIDVREARLTHAELLLRPLAANRGSVAKARATTGCTRLPIESDDALLTGGSSCSLPSSNTQARRFRALHTIRATGALSLLDTSLQCTRRRMC